VHTNIRNDKSITFLDVKEFYPPSLDSRITNHQISTQHRSDDCINMQGRDGMSCMWVMWDMMNEVMGIVGLINNRLSIIILNV
jgi:hypothetical protein